MQYVTNHPDVVADFAARFIPHCWRGFGQCAALGVVDDEGRLIAGVVYHNWDPDAGLIEISGAALTPRWLTRETLRRMFEYPFEPPPVGLGLQMVVMRLPADNERLLSVLERYGFRFVHMPRLFGRDRDGVIARLTQEAWLENRFNKRRHLAAVPIEEAA